jgi:hypothetical protein
MNLERGFRRFVVASSLLVLAIGLSIAGYQYNRASSDETRRESLYKNYKDYAAQHLESFRQNNENYLSGLIDLTEYRSRAAKDARNNEELLETVRQAIKETYTYRQAGRTMTVTIALIAGLWGSFYVVRWIVLGFAGGTDGGST